MKTPFIRTTALATVAAAGALVLGTPLALAQTLGAQATVETTLSAHAGSTTVRAQVSTTVLDRAKTHANQEIDRRTDVLNKLIARIGNMKRVSAEEAQTLTTEIQAQVSALATLKTKIGSDSDRTTLKVDIKSITDSYRIYMLVVPQSAMFAMVDRLDTLIGDFTTLGSKLSARISASSSANISDAQNVYADYQAKVSDAQTQNAAAQAEISNLKPDDGDATIKASNTTALKDAHTKLRAARQDLVAARKDVNTILQALGEAQVNMHASSSASVSASSNAR